MQLSSKIDIKNGTPRGFPDHHWTLWPWGQPWRHLGRLFAIFRLFREAFSNPNTIKKDLNFKRTPILIQGPNVLLSSGPDGPKIHSKCPQNC